MTVCGERMFKEEGAARVKTATGEEAGVAGAEWGGVGGGGGGRHRKGTVEERLLGPGEPFKDGRVPLKHLSRGVASPN